MPNVSKKVNKTYSEKVNSGQKFVGLWLDLDKWEQIQRAAESVQEPMTTWIRRAIFGSLRKWEIPEASKLREKCSICGQKHDKSEHFKDD